jgi:hypothetical protein
MKRESFIKTSLLTLLSILIPKTKKPAFVDDFSRPKGRIPEWANNNGVCLSDIKESFGKISTDRRYQIAREYIESIEAEHIHNALYGDPNEKKTPFPGLDAIINTKGTVYNLKA